MMESAMRPDELLRRLRRKFGAELRGTQQGKGSHRTIYFRDRKTTLQKSGDFSAARIKEWLAQIGLTPKDLD